MVRLFFRTCALIVLGFTVTACSTTNPAYSDDPLHGWNKGVFAFNEAVDKAVIVPTAKGYRAVVPKPGRDGIRNILANLRSPAIFGSDLLQGKPGRAGDTLGRFVINTTLGLVGIFDVAKRMGIEKHNEDMGQTLATWGISSGPYVVLPILGPSNFRDMTGFVLDFGFDPLTYMRFNGRTEVSLGRIAISGLAAREANLGTIETLRENSIDGYIGLKSAYEQLRKDAISDGNLDIQDLPDFDEFEDEE